MSWFHLTRRALLLSFLALWSISCVSAPRVVAVGDVHGDYQQLVQVLRFAGVIGPDGHWSGGRSVLVQAGDIPDRGPDSRKAMELMMRLEREAVENGGRVHALIGNHEALNMMGDLRYVHPGEFEAFVGPDSAQRRAEWLSGRQGPTSTSDTASTAASSEDQGDAAAASIPLGWVEHRRAWQPTGSLGAWVLEHDSVVVVGQSMFVHGGLSPALLGVPLSQVNERIREELRSGQAGPGSYVEDPAGPLWYRDLASGDEKALEEHVDRVLTFYEVERIVVAHTPTGGAVIPRFGGRVLLIDVGLSEAYGGANACLILRDGDAFALHRGVEVPIPSDPAEVAAYLDRLAALEPDRESRERLWTRASELTGVRLPTGFDNL
ncbi:MAG: metallophosphoesterase [Myxococcota bacterium]